MSHHDSQVILVEPMPPPQPRATGGFLYNARITERLAARGLGRLVSVDPELGDIANRVRAAPGDLVLLDSLLLRSLEPRSVRELFPTARIRLLLHMLESRDPSLDARARARCLLREDAWISATEGIVTTSETLAEHLAEFTPLKPLIAVPPGIDEVFHAVRSEGRVQWNRAASPSTFKVVCVASLLPAKRQLELVRAVNRFAASRPGLHLELIGSAAFDPAYAAAVRAEARAGLVDLPGVLPQAEIARHLAAADLFALLSTHETFGMATAEALVAGVPVLVTKTGDAAREVQDGVSGVTLPPEDLTTLDAVLSAIVAGRSLPERPTAAPPPPAFKTWDAAASLLASIARFS